jgi:environmental stress-induced protein Ves
MVLDGTIILCHENHHSKLLNKFDIDEFEGNWKTTSIGKCTDFNLMTRDEVKGLLSAFAIEKTQSADYCCKEDTDWVFIYVYSGKVSVELNGINKALMKGDLLILKKPGNKKLKFKGIEDCDLVFSEITLH